MKKAKVDGKVRIGGSTTIEHGARGGGVPAHKMSEHIPVGHVPADADQFDQDHGVAPSAGSNSDE